MFVAAHTHTHTQTYTYTHTHTHIHTNMHTHTHTHYDITKPEAAVNFLRRKKLCRRDYLDYLKNRAKSEDMAVLQLIFTPVARLNLLLENLSDSSNFS